MSLETCPKWLTTKNVWIWYEKILNIKPKRYQKEIVANIAKVRMPKAPIDYAEGVLEEKCSGQENPM